MNRSEFNSLIRNPDSLSRSSLNELREVLMIFPWFQSAHMLVLKGLKSTDDVKFDIQLRESAPHISDRAKLYYLLNSSVDYRPSAEEVAGTSGVVTEVADSSGVVAEVADSGDAVVEVAGTSGVVAEVADSGDAVVEATDSGDVIAEVKDASGVVTDADESEKSISDFSPGATVPVDGAVVLTRTEDVLRAEIDKRLAEIDGSAQVASSEPDEDFLLEIEGSSVPVAIEEKEDYIGKNSLHTDLLEIENSAGRENSDSRTVNQKDLIERFIEINPRLEVNRDKEALPVSDLSEQHTSPVIPFASETLAKIYTEQGYYSRAIEIYDKLCLKYPEKSSYFADRIERINDLIKNS